MLTSLSIGRYLTQEPYDDAWSILSNARQLLPNNDSNYIKSGNVSILYLRTYLTTAADREDDITIARDFILFMMGHLWFQTTNDTVPLGYLAAVADLDEAAQFDWGSPILASLYHGLNTAVMTGGAITGFAQLLTTITWESWFDSVKLLSRKMMPLQVPSENCEYYLGDRCWRQLTGEARIPLDPPLSMSPHISPTALQKIRQAGFLDCKQFVIGEERGTYASYWAEQTSEVGHLLIDSQRMGNIDMFGPTALRAGITPVVVTSASIHSLSQDFSLPGKAEGPGPGAVAPGSWYAATCPIESARDARRLLELTDENDTLRRYLDSIDEQLYTDDLHLRRGRDVRAEPLPAGGGARTRQRESSLRTREGGTSRRGRGTGDDSE
ncbi:hypothetical protein GIB67_010721 [Kingdonia uniflora]|uniref:Aminotransferase-like plant mobile domain-containing protein n=1 Tax=Kingdonia uniflora TaxID=39325 RepID=A0A7J7L8M7_9MAGN|nr:hypothetical protein GIB67_010721 [Kingdonia uniflora]